MRGYVMVAGGVFALLTLVHIWRLIVEPHLARDPWFILVTVAAAALAIGAWRAVRRPPG